MSFDHGPCEFPVATVRAREPRARVIAMAGDLRRWLSARWDWIKPRTLPAIAAALGTLLVLRSVEYLSHVPAGVEHTSPVAASAPRTGAMMLARE